MMGIGFPELMIILVIIMIIFGAGKLPEIGSAFGRSIKNFKKSMKEAEAEDVPVEDGSSQEATATEQVEAAPKTAEALAGASSTRSSSMRTSGAWGFRFSISTMIRTAPIRFRSPIP